MEIEVILKDLADGTFLCKLCYVFVFKILGGTETIGLEDVKENFEEIRSFIFPRFVDTVRGLMFEKLKDTRLRFAIIPIGKATIQ